RSALLFEPSLALVAGPKNSSAVADDPAILIICKVHSHKSRGKSGRHRLPGPPAALGSQDGTPAADCPAVIAVAEIDVIQRPFGSRLLLDPSPARNGRIQDRPAVPDKPHL